MRIVGIDPGTRYTGIGVVERTENQLKYIHSEAISTKNLDRLEEKLMVIYTRISEVIEAYHPDIASIERIFHSVNPRSSLLLGHARGVAILVTKLYELDIYEYAPNEVKSAVVGVGRASKEQVGAMVKVLLNIDRDIKLKEDESDALAVAICHANTLEFSRIINQAYKTP